MVVPNSHVSNFDGLSGEEYSNIFDCVRLSEKVLRKVYNPQGINIGINLGEAAGAGIESHLHVHLLPRWAGDSNFMTTIAGTRIIPEDFSRSYLLLKEQFDNETTQN